MSPRAQLVMVENGEGNFFVTVRIRASESGVCACVSVCLFLFNITTYGRIWTNFR